MLRRDVVALGRLLAPDYQFTTAGRQTWGRDRAMAEFNDPDFSAESIVIEVERVVPSGEDWIVTGRSPVCAHIGQTDLSGDYRFSHTWRLSQEGWQGVEGRTSDVPT